MITSTWLPVADAAERVERSTRRLYEWLALPVDETGIRRVVVKRRTYVEVESLLAYEAQVREPGRPRKDAQP